MKVKRETIWEAFTKNWCPDCGKKTQMTALDTGLPGIGSKKCTECGTIYQSNFIEDGDDLVECPDHYLFENKRAAHAIHLPCQL